MARVFCSEVEQCLGGFVQERSNGCGFLSRSGATPGVFSSEVEQCLGFSAQKWSNGWGFLSKTGAAPRIFCPQVKQCHGWLLVLFCCCGFFGGKVKGGSPRGG